MIREHSTSYARITESDEGSNYFEMYIGKQGAQGIQSFNAKYDPEQKTWAITDTRDKSVAQYAPKALGGDGATSATKIAVAMVDQIVKKFLGGKPVKEPKVKTPKEPKVKVTKEPKEKVAKAAKAPKAAKVSKKGKATPDMILEDIPQVDEAASVEIAEGENAIAYKGRKFSYTSRDNEILRAVTVKCDDMEMSTTIGLKDDTLECVKNLAMRLCNDYTAGGHSKRK